MKKKKAEKKAKLAAADVLGTTVLHLIRQNGGELRLSTVDFPRGNYQISWRHEGTDIIFTEGESEE